MRETIATIAHVARTYPVLCWLVPFGTIVAVGCAYALQLLSAYTA